MLATWRRRDDVMAGAGPGPPSPPPAAIGWLSGAWLSGPTFQGNPAGHDAFAATRGYPCTIVNQFCGGKTWAALVQSVVGSNVTQYVGTKYAGSMYLSFHMFPVDGTSTIAAGATGAYTSGSTNYWYTIGQALVANGMRNCRIRIGYEYNGIWNQYFATATATDAAHFRTYYQLIITQLRAAGWTGKNYLCMVSGQNFSPSTVQSDLCYPGDDYCDGIAPDAYDQKNAHPGLTGAQRWTQWTFGNGTNDYALWWWIKFCQAGAHRLDSSPGAGTLITDGSTPALEFGLSEWGCGNTSWHNNGGGGDDPTYIQNVFALMSTLYATYGVVAAFDCYFHQDNNTNPTSANYECHCILGQTFFDFTQAGLKYQQLWGQS